MTSKTLDGSEVALLVCYEQTGKEDEWFVLFGHARLETDGLYFLGRQEGQRLPLSDGQIARAREVTEPMRHTFGSAAYFIPLVMADLPEGTTPAITSRQVLSFPSRESDSPRSRRGGSELP